MGSRGAFSPTLGRTGGIPLESRGYSTITVIGNIKVLQCDFSASNPAPTYSNTCNTTYFSYSKERGRIEHIYYYKNHKLVKSVDFDGKSAPHAHYWNNGVVGRKRHDKHNTHALTLRDKRLMNLTLNFNKQR